MSDTELNNNIVEEPVKKKRGRKKKSDILAESLAQNISITVQETTEDVENVPKKRGRKPKGGKLIVKDNSNALPVTQVANVILHLKCSLSELNTYNETRINLLNNPLEYNPAVPPTITTFNGKDADKYAPYDDSDNAKNNRLTNQDNAYDIVATKPANLLCSKCQNNTNAITTDKPIDDTDDVNLKDVTLKLKHIKIQLYKSNNPDKKSACFWCTYEYDNPTCYIPKYELDGEMCGYGSFCRPECAVAYLMKENIDDTTKFERYHLINQLYGKSHNYNKNIKPAPDPHYLLDKFYGNLTIQEYRKLLKTDHMLLVVEKPMTRILPELHDDMEDFGANIYGGKSVQYSNNNTGVYKVKRQSEKQKGPSKSEIMKENFGF
jgi:hypothetical protein